MASRGSTIRETSLGDIAAYVEDLQVRKLSPTAQRLYITVLRVFFEWCLEEGWVDTNPSRQIRRPESRSTMLKIPPYPLFQKLLESIPDGRTLDVRDRTILLMLYNAGLRVSELCSLRLDSVDLATGDFLVLGKGALVRQALVSGDALQSLRQWVLHHRPRIDQGRSPALFLSLWGSPLRQADIQTMMKQRCAEASISDRYLYPSGARRGILTPHSLRHLHASRMLELSVSLPVIQTSLGHRSLSSTAIYLRPRVRCLHDAHRILDAAEGDVAAD
jgi:site-specific recombinase XerD